ncbi:MAG: LVIVD repeat-containing protein [Actinomycetota bacterium]
MPHTRRRVALASALLVSASLSTGSAPALPPVAAVASSNIELVGIVPDPGAIGGRILGDTLYATALGGLRIYDLSQGDMPSLIGTFALPTYQNEDIDTNGEILLMSSDFLVGVPNILTVVDVSDPSSPERLSSIQVPAAHTASCILDCSYAWMGGASGRMHVVDLREPTAPKVVGSFIVPGLVHDVQVDEEGLAWVSSGGGLFAFDPSTDPVQPTQVLELRNKTPGSFENDFILHNSLRSGDQILVVEEDWDPLSNGRCTNDGAFQTGRVFREDGALRVTKQDRFSLGRGDLAQGQTDRLPTAPLSCSAHYFGARGDGIVAVAWYEQGMRLLDVSDPTDIRQVGYHLPVGETITTLIRDDLVYAFDTVRGLEVLRVTVAPGDPALDAPVVQPSASAPRLQPSPRWGWACRIPAA